MRRAIIPILRCSLALVAASLVWAGAAPAGADPALALELDSETQIIVSNPDGSGSAEGEFMASGPAVAAEAVCPAGVVVDEFVVISDDEGPRIARATETYTCEDGSGSFQLLFRGRRTSIEGALFTFKAKVVITKGTGAYSGLRAEGSGVTVLDLSSGEIQNDYDFDVHAS